jgi:hypothetical protein
MNRLPFSHQRQVNWQRLLATATTLALLLQLGLPFLPLPGVPLAKAATFAVNLFTDAVDANPGDGVCDSDAGTGGDQCTLRAAIMETNVLTSSDSITVPAGTYNLTISDTGGEDLAASGDLDIVTVDPETTTITGLGSGAIINGNFGTVIGANVENRIFHIIEGSGDVFFTNLTIQGGLADRASGQRSEGGGIRTENNTRLTLTDVTIRNNTAENGGGGILNRSKPLTLNRVTISGNVSGAGGGIGSGGGIRNENNGQVLGQNVTISGNTASNNGLGGGIRNLDNPTLIAMTHVTIVGNTVSGSGSQEGSGIYNTVLTPTLMINSIVANNTGGTVQCFGTVGETGGVSLTSDGSCSFTLKNTNPNVAPLAGNGGSTQTHALNAGSAAVDRAPTTSPATTQDQRQVSRPFNVPGVNDLLAGNDIGAFELDSLPGLSINDPAAVLEGNAGTSPINFTISLNATSLTTVTVRYVTADDSATLANNDYITATGVVTFPPGSTTQPVTITINGDTNGEPTENFFVNLFSPTWATIVDGQGLGTITDDDAGGLPAVSINDANVSEGATGTTVISLTVRLSAASGGTVTVDYATADNTATVADNDYEAKNGQVTFNPGDVNKIVTVLVKGDLKIEGDETFLVNISNASGAVLADTQALGTILNDDSGLYLPYIIKP